MATDGNLSEVPLPMQRLPVRFGFVEDRQQRKERTGDLTPPPPVKIRSVEAKGRTPPSAGLPAEEKPPSDLCAASYGPLQPKEVPNPCSDTDHVMAWRHFRLPTPVYVRVDRSGVYHSYPELPGGPFESLDAFESAFHTYARGSSTDTSKETKKECLIRESLEWSDGTRKVATSSKIAERETDNVQRLVKALLDKKNEDQDLKYELEHIVHWQLICEGPNAWYYHFNITMKTKGVNDDAGSVNLFFAEATRDQRDTPGYFLCCFCRIDPNSKDVNCHGCTNNGSIHMKHPSTHFYCGQTDLSLCYDACNNEEDDDEEEELREEEERIRESFDYLDDVEFMEKLRKKRAELLALHSKIQEDEETSCKD
ncbi:hypothetical protein ACQJBY_031857 [Aegilops geniculata]